MRAAVFALLAIGCHHRTARVDNAAPPREGTSIAVYDRGDGTATEVVDDRRWLDLRPGQHTLVLDDIDPAAALPSLVIEPAGAALHIGACRRDEVGEAAAAQVHEHALQRSLEGELPEPTVRTATATASGPATFAPIVTCDADGAPGRYLVRVLYLTSGLPYRAQHEVRMASPDRATVRSTYTLATPAWHRTADVTVFDGAPGGSHVPQQLARGQVVLDGSSGAIVVPEREVKGRLRRIFDGAVPTSTDIASSDIQWGEGSREVVWVWLELADARIPPGPVHAILDLPNELARVSDIAIEARQGDDPDAPTRLAIYADDELHGSRQRWHDFVDSAELADRFSMSVSNTGDEPRDVWIEEHLRAAKRRVVTHAWPRPPGLHGEILRTKVTVRPGKTVRVGFTVDYDF